MHVRPVGVLRCRGSLDDLAHDGTLVPGWSIRGSYRVDNLHVPLVAGVDL